MLKSNLNSLALYDNMRHMLNFIKEKTLWPFLCNSIVCFKFVL